MMRSIAMAFALALLAAGTALADQDPTYTGPESASEKAFVQSIQADLNARFPTAADAVKAGYIRYTNPDDTGAISYADLHWYSTDPKHPSQLWYDRKGHLLGADFSVPLAVSKTRPDLWGVNPGRWAEFDGHIHWVSKDAAGNIAYDQYLEDPKVVAAGINPDTIAAQDIVKLKKVEQVSQVLTVFHFPSLWDLIVWVKPNPNGAFAYKNPTVQ